jgi:hypothetical protein
VRFRQPSLRQPSLRLALVLIDPDCAQGPS